MNNTNQIIKLIYTFVRKEIWPMMRNAANQRERILVNYAVYIQHLQHMSAIAMMLIGY